MQGNPVDDQKLLRKVAARDHTAFRSLVEQYQSLVMRTCYRILGNREDAEDVAQEVFLKMYQKAKTFRGESQISTWLYRVAVNLSLNLLRKRKRVRYLDFFTVSKNQPEGPAITLKSSEDNRPDRKLEKTEKSRILKKALDSLPEKQRVAMILHKFEGLSHREIADILQTSLSSVESLIHRAKGNLQKKLLPWLKEI